jgi:hypothetical protein
MRKNDARKPYDPSDEVDENAPMTAQNPNDLEPDAGESTLEKVQENARIASGDEPRSPDSK